MHKKKIKRGEEKKTLEKNYKRRVLYFNKRHTYYTHDNIYETILVYAWILFRYLIIYVYLAFILSRY